MVGAQGKGIRLDGCSAPTSTLEEKSPIKALLASKGTSSASSTVLGSHCPSVTLHQSMSARTRLPDVSDAAERLFLRARAGLAERELEEEYGDGRTAGEEAVRRREGMAA